MGSSLQQRSPRQPGIPRPTAARARSRPLAEPPAGPPSPGRPYLAVQPREVAAAAGREARGPGAARPWPGTRWVAAAAVALCLLGGGAGAAAGARHSGGRRREQPDGPRPPGRAPLTLRNPPTPGPPRLRPAPGLACPDSARPWVRHGSAGRLLKPLLKGPRLIPNPQRPIPGKRPRPGRPRPSRAQGFEAPDVCPNPAPSQLFKGRRFPGRHPKAATRGRQSRAQFGCRR
ncbi:basic proline-rich protein-like [Mustela nigripes]|uniref:basic proline-rich protein-like n=1 Tax=Mustela nigripes TaxID=77151 RepID=UPI0028156D17|nr:basic proline-rich protein-like [Mustela nigripes]XP_059264403.1 basic proline-rich protein-like [Mustela nigripes]